ncbi:MAG: hypothetical protein ACI4KR_07365 [Ruminiclostridium sp.]
MIFEEVEKADVSTESGTLSAYKAIVFGVNGYRTKVVDSCFGKNGVNVYEIPYFVAALRLAVEDLEAVVKRHEGELGTFNEFVDAVDEIANTVRRATKVIEIKREET